MKGAGSSPFLKRSDNPTGALFETGIRFSLIKEIAGIHGKLIYCIDNINIMMDNSN